VHIRGDVRSIFVLFGQKILKGVSEIVILVRLPQEVS
jgi:hypothetical protein